MPAGVECKDRKKHKKACKREASLFFCRKILRALPEAPVWLMNLMGEDGDRRVPAGQWLQTAAIEKPCNELLMRLLEEEDAKCEWPWGNASSMAFLMPVPDLREVIVLKRGRNKMRQVRVWRTNAKIVYCM